jgi:hypothetical protein
MAQMAAARLSDAESTRRNWIAALDTLQKSCVSSMSEQQRTDVQARRKHLDQLVDGTTVREIVEAIEYFALGGFPEKLLALLVATPLLPRAINTGRSDLERLAMSLFEEAEVDASSQQAELRRTKKLKVSRTALANEQECRKEFLHWRTRHCLADLISTGLCMVTQMYNARGEVDWTSNSCELSSKESHREFVADCALKVVAQLRDARARHTEPGDEDKARKIGGLLGEWESFETEISTACRQR